MKILLCLVGLVLVTQPARANGWQFVNDPEDLKFGYQLSGQDNFETLFFRCDNETKRIAVSAAVGNRRPRSGQSVVTLSAGSNKVTLSGLIPDDEFDGVYWLEVDLDKAHGLFRLLASGKAIAYTAPGWRRPQLSSRGQKVELERFLAACK